MPHLSAIIEEDNAVSIPKGMTKTLRLTVTDEDGRVDLTGATIYFTVKEKAEDVAFNLQKITPTEIVLQTQTVDATKGQALILILPADTIGLSTSTTYVYDTVVVLGTDRHQVIPNTSFTVTTTVTVVP